MASVGGTCVFASECDTFARITYEYHFKKNNSGLFLNGNFNRNIHDVDTNTIPDFNVLCAGFPCQPFSAAGLKMGFADTRGTLFFRIASIINTKKKCGSPPKVLLLENVKGLRGHDKGRTLKKIIHVLNTLDYTVCLKVINTRHFGIPQNRDRLFIVAWLNNTKSRNEFIFPLGLDRNNNPIFDEKQLSFKSKPVKVGDILCAKVDEKYTISDRLYKGHIRRLLKHRKKGNGFGFSLFNESSPYTNTISARYYKDGSEILIKQKNKNPRKLSPEEAGRLQGYPINEGFTIVVSDFQAYKQFGNSVSIPVVKTIAKEIVRQIL